MKFCASTPLTRKFLQYLQIKDEFQPLSDDKTIEALLIGRLLLHDPSARKVHREMTHGDSIATWYRCIKYITSLPFHYVDSVFNFNEKGLLRMDRTGVFIIDGHVIPHYGKHMEAVSKAYSSIEKHPILGLETEVIHYWSPTSQFPVDYRIFLAETDLCITRKKATFKTKNELVREMIQALVSRNIEPDTFLIDAGLGVQDTLKVINFYHKKYVTRPKKNFGVTYLHKHQLISVLFESIPLSEFQQVTVQNPKNQQIYNYNAAIRDVYMAGLGTQRLIFIDASNLSNEEQADTMPSQELETVNHRKFRVFLSNQVTWSAAEILSLYSLRWTIETSFRDENQNVGFHECKFCLYAHQQLFLGISFLSYLFLAWARTQSTLCAYGDIDSTLGEINRAFQHYCQEEYVQYVHSLSETVSCKQELDCLKTRMYSS